MATNTTQYFQSSLLAQELEDTWTGTVRFNAEQGLSESQKAQARENIGAVPFGSNLKILGHFDTVAELQASAPQNVGDAYSVGTTTPYHLYIFDGLRNEWKDYGQIRAADISAQYVENQVIAVSAWTQDDTSLAGYSYKAQIAVSGATGDDFPIVAFNQSDAVSGNFAPLSFSLEGYIEIWAKTIPTASVTIPVVTIIVNGGGGRGITNATGGIATGSIKTANLADGSVTAPKIAGGAVTRAKLAQDALYSPMQRARATPYTVQLSDVGKTLAPSASLSSSTDIVFNIDDTLAAAPDGMEFAIFYRRGASLTINFSGKQYSACLGHKNWNTNRSYVIPELFGMCAIKKVDYGSEYNYWLVTGNVEVVS